MRDLRSGDYDEISYKGYSRDRSCDRVDSSGTGLVSDRDKGLRCPQCFRSNCRITLHPSNALDFTLQMELLHKVSQLESQKPEVRPLQKSLYWRIGSTLVGISICATLAACGMNESLWLDELHTSWSIAGEFDEVVSRSQQGNQTPFFATLLKGWTLGLGKLGLLDRGSGGIVVTEWALRLPSLIAYCLSIVLFCQVVWTAGVRRVSLAGTSDSGVRQGGFVGLSIALLCLGLSLLYFGLDRIQLFYATEARVYSLVQLLSFVGWLLVFTQYTWSKGEVNSRRDVVLLVAWFVVALSLIHLHLVSVIVVIWQAGILSVARLGIRNQSRGGVVLFIGLALASALACLPLVWDYLYVWERRQQWNRFAGDASWNALASQFPMAPLLVPAAVAFALDWLLRKLLRSRAAGQGQGEVLPKLLGWSVAWLGPLLTAWLLTWFEVAPLMHRRYLLASAIPMVMLAGLLIVHIRYRFVSFVAIGFSVFWLINAQPTLEIWQSGQWVGTQRGEYWREVSQWVQANYEEGDQVWCASDLIEGDSLNAPLSQEQDDYLSFPLRGIYAIRANDGDVVEPHSLVSDAGQWIVQWRSRGELSAGEGSGARLFVVARASSTSLNQIVIALRSIAEAEGLELRMEGPVQDFVFLSAVKLTLKAQ